MSRRVGAALRNQGLEVYVPPEPGIKISVMIYDWRKPLPGSPPPAPSPPAPPRRRWWRRG